MKKSIAKYIITGSILTLLFFTSTILAADSHVEIHQINVGNGDAALIKFYEKDKLVYTIIIDGGLKASDNEFIPYLKSFIPDMEGHPGIKQVNWVILSHNHMDHFKGLMEMFNDPVFLIRAITDQGGYDIGNNDYTMPLKDVSGSNFVPFITRDIRNHKPNDPQPSLTTYVQSIKTANDRLKAFDNSTITRTLGFDTTKKTFLYFNLPAIGGVVPKLNCVATNGYTLGSGSRMLSGAPSNDYNANNFCYAWILEFGEFRFYSGGDIGGANSGAYIDQETLIANNLVTTYPKAYPLTGPNQANNYPGHVCVMKTNHHGSTESSNATFLKTVSYSAIVTSAGHHSSWKIPTVAFVDRVAANPLFGAKTGIYFTQLYNYFGNQSLTEANTKFSGKATYDYITPGATQDLQYSFIFLIPPTYAYPGPPPVTLNITQHAYFSVYKVRTSDFTFSSEAFFLCHKPS